MIEREATEKDQTLLTQIEHAERTSGVIEPPPGWHGKAVKLLPQGWTLGAVPWEPDKPEMIHESLVFGETLGFMAYLKKFKSSSTLLLSDRDHSAIQAFIDYHGSDSPAWCRHKARLQLRQDPAWCDWLEHDGKVQTQEAFAGFLEEHLTQIVDPPAADLLGAINSFTIDGELKFSRVQRLASGAIKFLMHDERKASLDAIAIGDQFLLRITPWRGVTSHEEVVAKLRYRLSPEGILTLWYELRGIEECLESCWNDLRARVTEQVGIEILEGTKS